MSDVFPISPVFWELKVIPILHVGRGLPTKRAPLLVRIGWPIVLLCFFLALFSVSILFFILVFFFVFKFTNFIISETILNHESCFQFMNFSANCEHLLNFVTILLILEYFLNSHCPLQFMNIVWIYDFVFAMMNMF